jgi:hypothetical protein
MINIPPDKDRCATNPSLTVRPVANIVSESKGPASLKVRLVQEADVDTILTEELIQFQLLAANPVDVPISQPQGSSPFALLGRAVILSYEDDNGFLDSPWAIIACWEGGCR